LLRHPTLKRRGELLEHLQCMRDLAEGVGDPLFPVGNLPLAGDFELVGMLSANGSSTKLFRGYFDRLCARDTRVRIKSNADLTTIKKNQQSALLTSRRVKSSCLWLHTPDMDPATAMANQDFGCGLAYRVMHHAPVFGVRSRSSCKVDAPVCLQILHHLCLGRHRARKQRRLLRHRHDL
jgi:hypothetical protein